MGSSPNRLVAVVLGAVYLLVGVLGFTVTTDVAFAGPDGALLLGVFQVNPLHNTTHLLIGSALVIGAVSGVRAARTVNLLVGAAYLLLGIVGFFLTGPANFLALNVPGHLLHLGSAVVLLAVGLAADKNTRRTAAV